MRPDELPDALRDIALALQDMAALRPDHARVYVAWSAHLTQDARGLALVVQALEPLPEF